MELCAKCASFVALLLVIVCRFVISVDHGPNLLWSQKDAFGVARIVSITKNPDAWITTRQASTKYITAPGTKWHFKALAFHYNGRRLFWSDAGNKNIQGLHLNGSTVTTTLAEHTSAQVLGMAYDWANGNLYWTDALYDWIIIMSLSSNKLRTLHTSNTDSPFAIAVHPSKGYLFWTDHGDVPKIERSLLNGGDRRVLINNRLSHPSGITVDIANDRIYWVDSGRDTVESTDLHGNDRTQLFMVPGTSFYGIAIYKSYLFVTDLTASKLRVFGTGSSKVNLNFKLGATPYSIVMYDKWSQPQVNSSCGNFGCSDICVQLPEQNPQCLCEDGSQLSANNKTCAVSLDKDTRKPSFLVSTGSSICSLPYSLPTTSLSNHTLLVQSECIVGGKNGISALDFNWKQNMVYWQESGSGSIFRTRLLKGHPTQKVFDFEQFQSPTAKLTDLSVDWVSSYIYWADLQSKCIFVAKDDGTHAKKLICNDTFEPTALAVDPVGRRLFWFDRSKSVLERSLLDGTQRQDFIRFRNSNITRLAINFHDKRIYWTDVTKKTIESIGLSGSGRRIDFSRVSSSTLIGISFFKDFLVWTEQGMEGGVFTAVTGSTDMIQRIHHNSLSDIVALSSENQPDVFDNPCDIRGTICDGLCFPLGPSNSTCACGEGLTLSMNGTCKSVVEVPKSFLLVTDSGLKKVYMVDMTSDEYNTKAIPLSPHENPVAIDYDWNGKYFYWTEVDSNVIKRSFLNGSHEEVFWNLPIDSITDGMAVDAPSQMLYYTDTGQNIIAAISIPERRHKKLITTSLDQPRAIVANSTYGYIFWTDWGTRPVIERANMDGSDRKVIVNTGPGTWPNALAIDYTANKLYWCDAKYNKINMYHLDTEVTVAVHREYVAHYFGMSLLGHNIYLTDWMKPYIMQYNINSSSVSRIGEKIFMRPNDIHGFYTSHVTTLGNACDNNGGCQQLCFPLPSSGRVCACQDDYHGPTLSGNCYKPTSTSSTKSSTTSTARTTQKIVETTLPPSASPKPMSSTPSRPTTLSTASVYASTSPSSQTKRTPSFDKTTGKSNEVVTKKSFNPENRDKENDVLPGKPKAAEQEEVTLRNYVIVGIVAAGVVVVTVAVIVAFFVQKKCKSRKTGTVGYHYSANEEVVWNDDGKLMVPMDNRRSRDYDRLTEEHDNFDSIDNITYDDNRQLLVT